METYELERAARLFYNFCVCHPELCPHDYRWSWSKIEGDKEIEHYKCDICGNEIEKEKIKR